jgi:hypothetical protein
MTDISLHRFEISTRKNYNVANLVNVCISKEKNRSMLVVVKLCLLRKKVLISENVSKDDNNLASDQKVHSNG